MDSHLFINLLIGLQTWFDKQQAYPYPDQLRYSLNQLALELPPTRLPRTFSGMLKLFTVELQSWWIGNFPIGFDPEAPIIEGKQLSYEAADYLLTFAEANSLGGYPSLQQLALIQHNQSFDTIRRDILNGYNNALKEQNKALAQVLQGEYNTFRTFLIRKFHPTYEEIDEQFATAIFATSKRVIELYNDSTHQQPLWFCKLCGLLQNHNNDLSSIKPTACGKRCLPRDKHWYSVDNHDTALTLKAGLHLRVLIPGIPELALYDWLCDMQADNPSLITGVALYPGLDRYDIEIQFVDSVWAIDVKDYSDPYHLAAQLTGIKGYGDLQPTERFYVYPAYRDIQRRARNYGEIVRSFSEEKRGNTAILSDEELQNRVLQKLKSLGRKR